MLININNIWISLASGCVKKNYQEMAHLRRHRVIKTTVWSEPDVLIIIQLQPLIKNHLFTVVMNSFWHKF